MKIKSLLAASALSLSAASTAYAADIVIPNVEPIAPAFSWAGFYAGAQLGYGWHKDKNDVTYTFMAPNPAYDPINNPTVPDRVKKSVELDYDLKSNGIMGGLYAGYNMDVADSVIFGVETDFALTNTQKDFAQNYDKNANATDDADAYSYNSSSKVKWNGATRLRVGYGVDRMLPYVAAGVAYAGVNREISLIDHGATDPVIQNSQNSALIGWTIGAGIDYAAMDNVILRLEYRYSDYGKKDMDKSMNEDYAAVLTGKNTLSSNDLRVGVAYKF